MCAFLVNWLNRALDSGWGVPRQAAAERASMPDWFEECRRLHNSACGSRMNHDTRMILDAEHAKAAAS
jgi:hypothetical protein